MHDQYCCMNASWIVGGVILAVTFCIVAVVVVYKSLCETNTTRVGTIVAAPVAATTVFTTRELHYFLTQLYLNDRYT